MTYEESPYLLAEPPTSVGRVLLSRALAHWCAVHHGYSNEEVAQGLRGDDSEKALIQAVRFAARLIGELIAADRLRSFARPFGGGRPTFIEAADWELDDFTARFALSALDPTRPFDAAAPATAWIFVDLEGFNQLLDESCADIRPVTRAAAIIREASGEPPPAAVRTADNDLVRLPEVMRRTGMSRSTIYRRIKQGRFPEQLTMDGNIAAWRERDVADWLADPK